MTEAELRNHVVAVGKSYVGAKQYSDRHLRLLKLYNNAKKTYARAYTVQPADNYCATAVSAFFIEAGLSDIFPLECGCGEAVSIAANKMKCWVENDAYVPKPGDAILMHWSDTGTGDDTGWPNHIMLVESCDGKTIHCVNANDSNHNISEYDVPVNGKGIRGFITPNFASKATTETPLYVAAASQYCYVWADEKKSARCTYPALGEGNMVEVLAETDNFYKVRIAGKHVGYVEKTLRRK